MRSCIAKGTSAALTRGLHAAGRPAGNFPGKMALYIDPHLIAGLRGKLREGSVVVVGTNGKTTVTNLLADVVEASGRSVLCNRTGANLDSGIASALLQGKPSDWGVLECDELWLAKVLPDLRASYVLLLNLFRDQLDRCGEIDRIQDSIVSALQSSPETALIYNADDPLCAFIASRVQAERDQQITSGQDVCAFRSVAFGVSESMNLAQNAVADATMCQACSHMFRYEYRQYGQLGAYRCPHCGFARPALDFVASDVRFAADGLSFEVQREGGQPAPLHTKLAGSYMVYNLLAVYAAASTVGCSAEDAQRAMDAFDPKNGRLQEYVVDGRRTLLNLAKNPTGFNQNLRIVAEGEGPRGVAFFINDQVVDGRDISWIWDIDFEELVSQPGLVVFAGGSRRNDLQVRLKYAGVKAQLVDGIEDVFAALAKLGGQDGGAGAARAGAGAEDSFPADAPVYAIANYSALPPVKAKLDAMATGEGALGEGGVVAARGGVATADAAGVDAGAGAEAAAGKQHADADVRQDVAQPAEGATPVVIAHILPDLLNLYGDGGNVRILEQRLRWRGIPVEVRKLQYGDPIRFDDVDLVLLGGGPDREQKLASEELEAVRDEFAAYIEDGGPLLAICGGYQILGNTWLLGDDEVPGLGIVDIETRRPGTSADRLVDNVALKSPIADAPVIGYENHAGRTYLGDGVEPFGAVVSRVGKGNNDEDGTHADGVLAGNVLGTYLHGTLLAKNPDVADWLLRKALDRHAVRTGEDAQVLDALDDSEELAANAFMAKKLL